MFGGGGDMRQMEQMMKQLGMDMDEIDATQVTIESEDETIVFENVTVNKIDAQGQEMYQIIGSPSTRQSSGGESETQSDTHTGTDIPEEDIELVSNNAGVPEEQARKVLQENGGNLADAVNQLN